MHYFFFVFISAGALDPINFINNELFLLIRKKLHNS